MITIRYHYKEQHNMSMKCSEVLFSKEALNAWRERMKDKVKNVTVI